MAVATARRRTKTAAVTIRNIPRDVHVALKKRAEEHGVSTEAEIRTILSDAVQPQPKVSPADMLVEFGRKYGELVYVRDKTPAESPDFG